MMHIIARCEQSIKEGRAEDMGGVATFVQNALDGEPRAEIVILPWEETEEAAMATLHGAMAMAAIVPIEINLAKVEVAIQELRSTRQTIQGIRDGRRSSMSALKVAVSNSLDKKAVEKLIVTTAGRITSPPTKKTPTSRTDAIVRMGELVDDWRTL